eukprot:2929201-Amphidinium_carterae.1
MDWTGLVLAGVDHLCDEQNLHTPQSTLRRAPCRLGKNRTGGVLRGVCSRDREGDRIQGLMPE